MNEIDVNEIVVFNKLPFGKQNFKYFIGYKYKRLGFYAYTFQKWVHVEVEVLIKIIVCILI